MTDRALVTVIIPNYNGLKFLPRCIDALRSQEDAVFDILVVDNASADGSAGWLKKAGIRTIELADNLGFAGGVNTGIRAVDTPYVLLLNNDAYPKEHFVREMLDTIERSPRIFSVSAMMIMDRDHTRIDGAGDGLTVTGWAYQRGTDEPVTRYLKSRMIFSSCAGAAIYRKSILDEIGLFDEAHFAYLEDIDISYRAVLAGYCNYYQPRAQVYHVGSGTSGSKYNPFKVRLSARNNIYMLYKNQPLPQLLINAFPILAGMIVKAVFFLGKGYLGEYLEGVTEGLKYCRVLKKAPPARRGIFTYLYVEGALLAGMAEYTVSWLRRHI